MFKFGEYGGKYNLTLLISGIVQYQGKMSRKKGYISKKITYYDLAKYTNDMTL